MDLHGRSIAIPQFGGFRPPWRGQQPTSSKRMMHPPPHTAMRRPHLPPRSYGTFRGGFRGRSHFSPNNYLRGVSNNSKTIHKQRPYIDLSKPFVTETIRAEFSEKNKLLSCAKASNNEADWTKYREKRDVCDKLYQNAAEPSIQNEWLQFQHPEDNELSRQGLFTIDNSCIFSCDTCDRDFQEKWQFDKHMSEHRVCNLDGCTFTAHEKVIEKHVRMQHATGLYEKIRNINTPEDIARWIEERKKKYPSKQNIQARQKEQEENLKKGLRICVNKNKFGRDKFRFQPHKNQKFIPKRKASNNNRFTKKQPTISLINEKCDWNGNMFPFKGTSALFNEPEQKESDFEDEEWSEQPIIKVVTKVNNSLGALMGAYASDYESEEEDTTILKPKEPLTIEEKIETKTAVPDETKSQLNDSDNEPPDEVKTPREPDIAALTIQEKPIPAKTNNALKRKRKKHTKQSTRKSNTAKHKRGPEKPSEFPYAFKKRRVTLLERLLQNEIRHERNVLLQCVRYVVSNNFFQK